MGRTVEYIKIVEEDLRRGCRTKTAIPYGRDSCIAWNRCHIFTNKRGTYGIIADDLRFDTQLSNVYGNAIRHARCQKLFLFSLSVAKQKKKAELFCKERLWKDISRSDGKDSTRSTRKKGRSGTDHQRVWDTAEDKPAYPGRSFV